MNKVKRQIELELNESPSLSVVSSVSSLVLGLRRVSDEVGNIACDVNASARIVLEALHQ